MLPRRARLRSSREFSRVVARGRRCGRRHLVVHLLVPERVVDPKDAVDFAEGLVDAEVPGRGTGAPEHAERREPGTPTSSATTTAGFVVSSAVGGSVVRHAVTRRLRPLVAARLARLPEGSRLVVRALPAAARADSATLAADLDSALSKLGYALAEVGR